MSPAELDSWLRRFYIGVRNQKGEEYEPSTLRGMEGSFDRHLRENDYGPGLSLITSVQFAKSRDALKSKQKALKSQGKGNLPRKADPLTDDEINTLFEKKQLGPYTPTSVINTLWYNNTTQFGLRGGANEHRQLCWGDIQLKCDSDGQEYLELNERQTKTRTGVNITDVRTVTPKMWALPNDPVHCPVFLYKIYGNKRPDDFSSPEHPFYLAVNTRNMSPGEDETWFIREPIGVNKLGKLMPRMAKQAGLSSDKHITNHSARKYMIQKLSASNIPPTHIMQISGHKNVQSINNYSEISIQQHQNISEILSSRPSNMLVPVTSRPAPAFSGSSQRAVGLGLAQCSATEVGANYGPSVRQPLAILSQPDPNILPSNPGSGLFRDCTITNVYIKNYNCSSAAFQPQRIRRPVIIDSHSDSD